MLVCNPVTLGHLARGFKRVTHTNRFNSMIADPALMTLDNMRAIGIRNLSVLCRCGRNSEVNADRFDGFLLVVRMHEHFRCGECGHRPQSVRPGPMERDAIGAGSGHWTGERDPLYRPGDEALLDY